MRLRAETFQSMCQLTRLGQEIDIKVDCLLAFKQGASAMDRDRQIALLAKADERRKTATSAWIQDPRVKASTRANHEFVRALKASAKRKLG
jgi:hypothetical protein